MQDEPLYMCIVILSSARRVASEPDGMFGVYTNEETSYTFRKRNLPPLKMICHRLGLYMTYSAALVSF